jgi:UDP-glucoronosyl and UDP-glucosyl transferase
VRVLGTEGLRSRFESAGADFRPYRYAPDNDTRSAATDLVREWEARTPLGMFARVRDRVMFGPAREFCRDVLEELDREPADLVAVDTLIPSALSGAEAAGCPSVLLMHGPYMMPRPDAPPPGTGFMPAHGPLGRWRDRTVASLMNRVFRTALPAFNQARAEFGLAPVRDLADVINAASRVLVCTSPSYDFAAATVPGYVRSAVLTHGGHGTVIKALTAGVPLVVVPLGRDQPDNAARVVHAGAGLRLSKKAGVPALRDAIARVVDEPRYRAAARRMAATLAAERDEGLVVDELERATLSHPVHRDPSRR